MSDRATQLKLENIDGQVFNPATDENQVLILDELQLLNLKDFATASNQVILIDEAQTKKAYDATNSTSTPLIANANWTGEWIDTDSFIQAQVVVITDQDAAIGGLRFEVSQDGVNVLHPHVFSPTANAPDGHHYPTTLDAKYFRVNYTNGTTGQGTFVISTTLAKAASEEGHVHPVNYEIDDDHPASIVKAILTGKRADGDYGNVNLTNNNNIKVSLEELEVEAREYLNLYPVGTGSNGSVTLTSANTAYAIPTTPPAGSYVLNINSLSDVSIFVGYENSNANGMEFMAGDPPAEISLGANQSVYAYCASAGKVVSYTLKEIN